MRVFLIIWLPSALVIYLMWSFALLDFDVRVWSVRDRSSLMLIESAWFFFLLGIWEKVENKKGAQS